jgi:NAD(P)-dependent dehydrogenase (short-subunit alcohol dehydrogenase family)
MSGLGGKVVLITGGGAGIGEAACIACAKEGAKVIVAAPGRNGEGTAATIQQFGGIARYVQADVGSLADMQRAVAEAVEHFGGLDGLVHNATSRESSVVTKLTDLQPAALEDHLAVSVGGAFNCAKAALPPLRERRGRFVVMTSPAAMEGSSTLPAYGTVKGALRGFAKSLALEEGPHGVNVTAISPLAVTPALHRAFQSNPELGARLEQLVPLGWIGDPLLDIAPVVAFLLGDGARYINGQTVVVDGGRFTGL